jgi:hypothetical protein
LQLGDESYHEEDFDEGQNKRSLDINDFRDDEAKEGPAKKKLRKQQKLQVSI